MYVTALLRFWNNGMICDFVTKLPKNEILYGVDTPARRARLKSSHKLLVLVAKHVHDEQESFTLYSRIQSMDIIAQEKISEILLDISIRKYLFSISTAAEHQRTI